MKHQRRDRLPATNRHGLKAAGEPAAIWATTVIAKVTGQAMYWGRCWSFASGSQRVEIVEREREKPVRSSGEMYAEQQSAGVRESESRCNVRG